ncbi:SDR family NAD(P)-dependent oxidoreductase [Streptomyces sp. DSM 42041]|uniref:SDR family NAD(P)-dependent oxidoreductase n=1 Tax=Streptomyces hazeniae TaxID=3075538 RepID=A0ABU2P0B3_9ACTN|nr:SDR family NAD(P)-dependent oxidoreductase [Streptomyces sp. DSM 42041]MDT0382692.1 SDR family NAD(P)-dependent oxidoreductase [Streptomyces sp. DSM 42041]
MDISSLVDTVLDRSVVLGYGKPGLYLRRRLPGWPADDGRMDGKVVLVTGAGSGIGLAAAAGFARRGASVRVLGRSPERAEQAARLTRERSGGDAAGEVRPVACDLSSLAELRDFTERFRRQEDRLDVLVNNAGVMPDERQHSPDGVELTFATHVLAAWALTDALTPLLERAAPSRVINVTSGGQYGQSLPVGDPQSEHSSYNPKAIYARTKRAQIVLTEQWAERLRDSGVHVHAMHPGWADTKGVRTWLPVFRALTRPIVRTPEQGADTVVWMGHTPETARTTGLFWHDRRPRPTTYRLGAKPDDDRTRRELWDHVAALATR